MREIREILRIAFFDVAVFLIVAGLFLYGVTALGISPIGDLSATQRQVYEYSFISLLPATLWSFAGLIWAGLIVERLAFRTVSNRVGAARAAFVVFCSILLVGLWASSDLLSWMLRPWPVTWGAAQTVRFFVLEGSFAWRTMIDVVFLFGLCLTFIGFFLLDSGRRTGIRLLRSIAFLSLILSFYGVSFVLAGNGGFYSPVSAAQAEWGLMLWFTNADMTILGAFLGSATCVTAFLLTRDV